MLGHASYTPPTILARHASPVTVHSPSLKHSFLTLVTPLERKQRQGLQILGPALHNIPQPHFVEEVQDSPSTASPPQAIGEPLGDWEGFRDGASLGTSLGDWEGFKEGEVDGFKEGEVDGFIEGFFDKDGVFDKDGATEIEGVDVGKALSQVPSKVHAIAQFPASSFGANGAWLQNPVFG